MAGVVDNIRKEVSGCSFEEVDIQKGQQGQLIQLYLKKSPTDDFHTQANMTPKQFFEMGDSEMKVTMGKFDPDQNTF